MLIIGRVLRFSSRKVRVLPVSIINDNVHICAISMGSWSKCAILQLLPISIIVAKPQDMFDIRRETRYFEVKVLHLLVSIIMIIGRFAV